MKKKKRKNGLQNVEKDGDWEMKKNQQNKLQNIVLGFRFRMLCFWFTGDLLDLNKSLKN